jgi:predicted nuclease of predicted toxin-antitoxin system
MRIYLDEDVAQPLLAKLLRGAGHDILMPGDVGMLGKSDAVQFGFAIRQNRVVIIANHEDFEDLHDLILIATGHHLGVLVFRRDNDPTRDMSLQAMVRAIAKVDAALPDLRDVFQVLNQWR